MAQLNRRQVLSLLAATGAAAAMPKAFAAPHVAPQPFSFHFFTDLHIQPELNAGTGVSMAFRHGRKFKSDFALLGGDHVFDSLAVPRERTLALYDLYDKTEQELGLKVYHTIGNHDVVGIYPASGMPPTDPLYGKKLFRDHFGKLYYSFNHKGYHFIVLDSISITDKHSYEGRIDAEQMQWLAAELAAQPAGTPIIVCSHIPLVTAMERYLPPASKPSSQINVINSNEVVPLFTGYNVIGVLQGHTHVNETVIYKGIPYITSGAVCGNWWQGTRLGFPEGFTMVNVSGNKLTTHYETYGFHAVEPQHNT